jgi:DNA polymerase-1
LAAKEFAFDTETTGLEDDMEIVGLSFSVKPGQAYYVPCPKDFIEAQKIVKEFEPAPNQNSSKALEVVGHEYRKSIMRV